MTLTSQLGSPSKRPTCHEMNPRTSCLYNFYACVWIFFFWGGFKGLDFSFTDIYPLEFVGFKGWIFFTDMLLKHDPISEVKLKITVSCRISIQGRFRISPSWIFIKSRFVGQDRAVCWWWQGLKLSAASSNSQSIHNEDIFEEVYGS